MAVNKRKVLDAARKFAQKGAKEKALKEYNTLLKLDPRDAKLHLEIGDAYRRWGQMDEAVTQYTRVAEQYKQDGFDARSVAVYKQILNIDSKRYVAHVALSEVYQRMGLESEAIQALQAAADGYRQEGKKREALELLRKMAQLDPTNTTSRMKVAELLQQEGMEDDAVAEYEAVVEELQRSGGSKQVPQVYERILELQPARGDLLLAMARHYLDAREPGRAEPFACRALESAPGEPELHELLCEIYRALDRPDELESATRTLAEIHRDRGDEETARQIMQRLPSAPEFEAAEAEQAAEPAVAEDELAGGGEPLLDDDDFLVSDEDDFDEPEDESGPPAPVPEGDPDQLFAEASVYLRYGKREQAIASLEAILAQEPSHREALEKLGEAHADGGADGQAVECWSRAAELARAADDAGGFDILHDRISALDPAAASALGPAPEGDAAAEVEDDFDDELGDLEFDVEDDEVFDDDDVEEFVLEDEQEDIVAADAEQDDFSVADDDGGELEAGGPELTGDVEVDLDDLEFDEDPLAERDEDGNVCEEEFESDDPELEELDIAIDLDDIDDGDEQEVLSDSPPDASKAAGNSTTMAQEIQEELEEAEFYFEQDLFDEAEALYQRVLERAPNHPSAMLRMGEIAARRGDDPSQSASSLSVDLEDGDSTQEVAGESGAEETFEDEEGDLEFDFGDDVDDDDDEDEVGDVDGDVDDEFEFDTEGDGEIAFEREEAADSEEDDDLAAALAEAAESVGNEIEQSDDPDDDTLEAIEGEASDLDLETPVGDDTTEVVEAADLSDSMPEAPAPSASAEVTQPVAVLDVEEDVEEDVEPDAEDGDFDLGRELSDEDSTLRADEDADEADEAAFDLGAELRESLEDGDTGEAAAGTSTSDDGFASIFNDFKKGVSETLSDSDYETRYDLGIAYREMELYDDAIGEFRMCLESPARRIGSLHMMALCALDLGRAADAVGHLEQALAGGDVPEEQRAGIEFDLGRAHHAQGDVERARAVFESVRAADPDFPGIQDHIEALESPGPIEVADGGFESFDDLVAEVEAVETETEEESFETFDDVITDAEACMQDQDAEPEVCAESEELIEAEAIVETEEAEETEEVPGPADGSPATDDDPKQGRRKKKISFV